MTDEKKVRSFEDLIAEEGLLPLDRTVDLVTQIAGAISVAETAGVTLDCFEPRAILVVDDLPPDGAGAPQTKVLGFARAADLPVRPGGARANYLAPEQQARDGEPVIRSAAALQFSLAVIAYEMLAGCPAFPEEIGDPSTPDSGTRVPARPSPPPVSELVMGVSSGLDQVLRRALSILPNQRYERIDDFVSALREVADPGAVWDDGATVIWSPAAGDMEPAAPAFARTLPPPPIQPPAPSPTRSARLAGAARRVRSSVRSSAGALVDRYLPDHSPDLGRELPPRGVGPAPRSSMPQMGVGGALPAGSAQGMAFPAFPATAMPSRRTQMSFLAAAVALVLGAVGVMSGSRVKTPVDISQTESVVFVPDSIRPRPRIEALPSSPSPRAAARSVAPAPESAVVVGSQAPRQPVRPARAHSRRGGAHRSGPTRR